MGSEHAEGIKRLPGPAAGSSAASSSVAGSASGSASGSDSGSSPSGSFDFLQPGAARSWNKQGECRQAVKATMTLTKYIGSNNNNNCYK